MSLYLDSPLSDTKMDISDTTTSIDSAVVSPVAEDEELHIKNNHNENSQNLNSAISENIVSDVIGDDENALVANNISTGTCLDNRIKQCSNGLLSLSLDQTANMSIKQKQKSIIRTLANTSHPLMSPTQGSDSDAEQNHQTHNVNNKSEQQSIDPNQCDYKYHNNFPDVVPENEHHLQQQQLQTHYIKNDKTGANNANVNANSNTNGLAMRNNFNKLARLRAHSPDLLSSESEADVSQYHAAVKNNFQSVALIPNVPTVSDSGLKPLKKNGRSVIGAGGEDILSLDSISNHSFDDDEDLEHNLASLSPSSSLIDGLDDDDDDDEDDDVYCDGPVFLPNAKRLANDYADLSDDNLYPEAITPIPPSANGDLCETNTNAEALPQYSAAEERRDSRNWQKITLPDGRTRDIDMRVIEPYKRVLSHGGYLKAGGHNAIVIFCACHLPDRSRADYSYVMDNLFLYVVKTLEQLVTEDYVLIYLHGGTSRRNVPPFPWLKKCYQLLDRRLRKSLKNMYLVHPTFWIKSIVWMARPFVSTKFWRKLVYVKSLEELNIHVAVEKAAIPEKVKQYDAKHN